MGCDIHIAVEKKVDNKWVMVRRIEWMKYAHGHERNYARFSSLCGIRDYRGESKSKPKGIPADVSESTNLYVDEFGVDGHSHSWHMMRDACDIFVETEYDPKTNYYKEYPSCHYFGVDDHHIEKDGWENYRIVYFFDN